MTNFQPHTFHIPVLGLCFSIDTPLKVARYGIDSVVSIVEDELIEHMRAYHSLRNGRDYVPIPESEYDYRAKRITAYLNMLQDLVDEQLALLKTQFPEPESDLLKYIEMLPEGASLKEQLLCYRQESEEVIKDRILAEIRSTIVAGSIDVNIMAKVDRFRYDADGNKLPDEFSDALSALRGFAQSRLSSGVVFSAGYNPRLFAYATQFPDFFPDKSGSLKKRIILKVSDFRSALVQGKSLARKGLWVSEFRIESGLNCGGHAFATEGLLMGPILEEFKRNREEMRLELFQTCNDALIQKGNVPLPANISQRVTAQGGIGTAAEQAMLMEYYELDGTGWGSPFLLVPEATNVDDETLLQLATASKDDFYLSNASPLGVPFNNFRKSSSEAQRKQRIERNRSGSPCYKEYLVSDTEFTQQAICTASRQYQHLKLKQLQQGGYAPSDVAEQINAIQERDCLCEGLTASVRLKNDMYLPHQLSAVAICPGPNLAYFSGVFSLKDMVDHIYGRVDKRNSLARPHMFINELRLYLDYFRKQVITTANPKALKKFRANLLEGIDYYKTLLPQALEELNECQKVIEGTEV